MMHLIEQIKAAKFTPVKRVRNGGNKLPVNVVSFVSNSRTTGVMVLNIPAATAEICGLHRNWRIEISECRQLLKVVADSEGEFTRTASATASVRITVTDIARRLGIEPLTHYNAHSDEGVVYIDLRKPVNV